MDGLLIKSIPQPLLARILLQLYILPQHLLSHIDLLQILAEGHKVYGDGCDLNEFLSFCYTKSIQQIEEKLNNNKESIVWPWCYLTLSQYSDWDNLDQKQYNNVDNVGLRLQISSETVRPGIDLIRYGRKNTLLLDKKFAYQQEERHIPIDSILNGTLSYITNNPKLIPDNSKLVSMINQRLSQFKLDTQKNQQSQKQYEIDYILTGVLMVKYDALSYSGMIDNAWCLYLRDYVGDYSGSKWRIISSANDPNEKEIKISSQQALADIRGTPVGDNQPSLPSMNYRPVYLFYCNHDIITRSAQESTTLTEMNYTSTASPSSNNTDDILIMTDNCLLTDEDMTDPTSLITINNSNNNKNNEDDGNDKPQLQLKLQSSSQQQQSQQNNSVFTYEDYAIDNDDPNDGDYIDDDDDPNKGKSALEDEVCKHCGIPDSIDDFNTIFFCDLCDLGVHQLCEDPPISSYEVDIDPWYCRACSKIINSTMPDTPSKTPRPNTEQNNTDNDHLNIKRQRLE